MLQPGLEAREVEQPKKCSVRPERAKQVHQIPKPSPTTVPAPFRIVTRVRPHLPAPFTHVCEGFCNILHFQVVT
jgi:hypothetical protein